MIKVMVKCMARKPKKKAGGLFMVRFPLKTERVQYQKRTRCLGVTIELDQRGNERKGRKKLIVVD